MNTQSIDCRKVEFGELKQPGDFCFNGDFTYIYIWLPGTSGPDALEIRKGQQGGPRVWTWDGNIEKPTITPSILSPGEWHGYMRAGRLEPC